MLGLGLGIGFLRERGPSVSEILALLGGADYTPLSDYSNCWTDSAGTTQATADSVVGKIASTVGSWVATQSTEGYKPILRHRFSYAPVVSSTTGETWTFTGTPIAGRAGIRIDESGERYFDTREQNGNYCTTPSAAANQITGDIFLKAKIKPDTWRPAEEKQIIAKYQSTSDRRSYRFGLKTDGKLILVTSATGDGTTLSQVSTESVPDSSSALWVAVGLDADSGSGNRSATFWTSEDNITWTQLGTTFIAAGVASIYASSSVVELGRWGSTNARFAGRIYYAAAYANDTGTGTPAWEFNPQRDCTDFPMNPYLDFDGTDDRLETNIAPGSYDAGYLCGGWTQMEALSVENAMFGNSANTSAAGFSTRISGAGYAEIVRRSGAAASVVGTDQKISVSAPFVHAASYSGAASVTTKLNGNATKTSEASCDPRGGTQVALIGASNGVSSGVSPVQFMQGSMFSQIWLPTIPTDEQQAVLRAYCASKAGVTL